MENRTTNPQNHHIYQASRRAQLPQNSSPQNLCFSKTSSVSEKSKKSITSCAPKIHTLPPIIMEVENGCIWKVTTIGGNHFSLPWLWEEGYHILNRTTELPLFQQQNRSSASRLRRLELIGGPARRKLWWILRESVGGRIITVVMIFIYIFWKIFLYKFSPYCGCYEISVYVFFWKKCCVF